MDRTEILGELAKFGSVVELKLLEGFGFVEYATNEEASRAVREFDASSSLAYEITLEFARPLRKDQPQPEYLGTVSLSRSGSSISDGMGAVARDNTYRDRDRDTSVSPPRTYRWPVIIKNLPRDLCWQELKDFSRSAGGLCAFCDIDKSNRSRGFIEYVSRKDAETAIRKLNGTKLGEKTVRLCFPEEDSHDSAPGLGSSSSQHSHSNNSHSQSVGHGGGGADFRRPGHGSRQKSRGRSASPDRRPWSQPGRRGEAEAGYRRGAGHAHAQHEPYHPSAAQFTSFTRSPPVPTTSSFSTSFSGLGGNPPQLWGPTGFQMPPGTAGTMTRGAVTFDSVEMLVQARHERQIQREREEREMCYQQSFARYSLY